MYRPPKVESIRGDYVTYWSKTAQDERKIGNNEINLVSDRLYRYCHFHFHYRCHCYYFNRYALTQRRDVNFEQHSRSDMRVFFHWHMWEQPFQWDIFHSWRTTTMKPKKKVETFNIPIWVSILWVGALGHPHRKQDRVFHFPRLFIPTASRSPKVDNPCVSTLDVSRERDHLWESREHFVPLIILHFLDW